jgi:hypothetical protein
MPIQKADDFSCFSTQQEEPTPPASLQANGNVGHIPGSQEGIMSIYLVRSLAGAAVLGSLLAACTGPGSSATPRIDLLGMPVIDDSAVLDSSRVITITPATRWVNVTDGDTVRFIAGDRSFAWNFQVSRTVSVFDLKQIAPPGTLPRPVLVYVEPNPLYDTDG